MHTDQKYMLNRSGLPSICRSFGNQDFNSGRIATIKSQGGWNSCKLSVKEVLA